jgi:phage terminase large subunit
VSEKAKANKKVWASELWFEELHEVEGVKMEFVLD